MRLRSELGLLRLSIVANAVLAGAILVDRFLLSNQTDVGPVSISEGASYAIYAVGATGLAFDMAWGRAALCVSVAIWIAREGKSDATQLRNLLFDLFYLSGGLLIAQSLFPLAHRAPAADANRSLSGRIANFQIELRSPLRAMRMCLGANLAIMIALLVDGFVHWGGVVNSPRTFGNLPIWSWPFVYLAAVIGLWLDRGWGRLAFYCFLMIVLVIGETGYATRLTNVLVDLFFTSTGVILAFFAKRNRFADADRHAVGDVFS